MGFSFFYNLVLVLITLVALPRLQYLRLRYGKYKQSFWQKLGRDFPQIDKGSRPLIWVHAVSVGETRAAAALVKKMKVEMGDPVILFTTTTETGQAEAKRSIPEAHAHLFLPMDFSWVIGPIVKRIRPDIVILTESDFWYHFLLKSKEQGALIVLVNGKISERSAKRFASIPWFTNKLFALFDRLCLQGEVYRQRFASLGIPADKLVVTGNMKFDADYPRLSNDELAKLHARMGVKSGQPVLVIGSTHSPEEELFIPIIQALWKKYPDLKVLLVPRHPERFTTVAQLLEKYQVPYGRDSLHQNDQPLLLVDAMGILRASYQLATVAIVAGSYTSAVGGHHILEPSWYGVPVIFGPHMHSQPDMVLLAKEYGAGAQVSENQLFESLDRLFENKKERDQMAQAGIRLSQDIQGATERTFQEISSLFSHSRCI